MRVSACRAALGLGALMLPSLACEAPTVEGFAPAYDPTSLTAGASYRWPTGATIAIHADPAAFPENPDIAELASVAAAAWAGSLGYREIAFRIAAGPTDADILVHDPRSALPVDTAGCGGPPWSDAAGSTFFCAAGDTARTLPLAGTDPGRIKVIVTVDRRTVATDGAFAALILHEMGHALGIGGHSPDPSDAMAAVPAGGVVTSRDSRTLRYVVHRPADLLL